MRCRCPPLFTTFVLVDDEGDMLAKVLIAPYLYGLAL